MLATALNDFKKIEVFPKISRPSQKLLLAVLKVKKQLFISDQNLFVFLFTNRLCCTKYMPSFQTRKRITVFCYQYNCRKY